MSTPISTPSGHTETPSNASNFMMQLLTSIGTLYAAMGRPPFTAQEPVSGVIETLEEASRRLSANASLQDLENRVLLLEQEKRAMLNGLAERDDQIARQRERLAELMGGSLSVMQKLAGARRTRLKLVPERPPGGGPAARTQSVLAGVQLRRWRGLGSHLAGVPPRQARGPHSAGLQALASTPHRVGHGAGTAGIPKPQCVRRRPCLASHLGRQHQRLALNTQRPGPR